MYVITTPSYLGHPLPSPPSLCHQLTHQQHNRNDFYYASTCIYCPRNGRPNISIAHQLNNQYRIFSLLFVCVCVRVSFVIVQRLSSDVTDINIISINITRIITIANKIIPSLKQCHSRLISTLKQQNVIISSAEFNVQWRPAKLCE